LWNASKEDDVRYFDIDGMCGTYLVIEGCEGDKADCEDEGRGPMV
jgi:hypothetical protein